MNIFTKIRLPKLGKNNFDLSYENKLTSQMGQLIPFVVQECIPGDEFKMSANILVRFNPMIAPLMHRVDVYTHYFFVPNRIIWDEFEDFITGGEDGLAMPEKPYMTYRELIKRQSDNSAPIIGFNSLSDYMGIPCNIDLNNPFGEGKTIKDYTREELDVILDEYDFADEKFDTLPFRAYTTIWNEYYRNQNVQPEVNYYKGSGLEPEKNVDNNNTNQLFTMRWRNWSLDYFTSALPFSQRGPEQLVPVNNIAIDFNNNGRARFVNSSTGDGVAVSDIETNAQGEINGLPAGSSQGNRISLNIDNSDALSLDNNASISIRELRRAERLQEFLERSARAGARYIEQIKGHFGVFSSDTRLQRPEYLGGGKQVVQISSVDQTSASNINGSSTPLGTPSGKAISGGTNNQFKTREIEEHGWIIGIISVLPKGGYHQGLPRKFTRFDKLDYFWPEFQNIGDQEIKTRELYCGQFNQSKQNKPELGFGYTPRYSEYKSCTDEVHGDFKGSLDFWHLNRKFDSVPYLSRAFVRTGAEGTTGIRQDIFAVQESNGQSVPNMYIDIYNNIIARRPMLYYDNPDL